jgi:phosphate transport system permease protein
VASATAAPLALAVDEYRLVSWDLAVDGQITVRRVDDGNILGRIAVAEQGISAVGLANDQSLIAIADTSGAVRLVRPRFVTSITDRDRADAALRDLPLGSLRSVPAGVASITPLDQIRIQTFQVDIGAPLDIGLSGPVNSLAVTGNQDGCMVLALGANGILRAARVVDKVHPITRRKITSTESESVAEGLTGTEQPQRVFVDQSGQQVFLLWNNGRLRRIAISGQVSGVMDDVSIFADNTTAQVTRAQLLTGGNSLLVGDDTGRVSVWFAGQTRPDEPLRARDGKRLVRAHDLVSNGAAISCLAVSSQSRMVAIGRSDGTVHLRHVTSERAVADLSGSTDLPVDERATVHALAVAPKDDGFLVLADGQMRSYGLKPRFGLTDTHADVSFASMFLPVRYEGYEDARHIWQSTVSSGDESKYGLFPLVFGTVKATFYALLFGVPVAILAAIFTSEFLRPEWKRRIKPVVELMASLPSVVLGFLVGAVLAPVVEEVVPGMLAAFITVPLVLLLSAFLWQLLPLRLALRHSQMRLPLMMLAIITGLALALPTGALLMEPLLFSGDVKRWLADRSFGSAAGGWMLILLPLMAVVMFFVSGRVVVPRMMEATIGWARGRLALLDLARFLVLVAATILVSWGIAQLLGRLGGETRLYPADQDYLNTTILWGDMLFGTYVQRNALLVGFAMGFAIIPIIYTIAEDALSSVPDTLRGASLGAGATPLQTALRVVVPTAASGLFAAVMVGLGRAVGETMIVLMAAGNTPVMEWNPFNGFQTLAAGIATEMPEAPKHGTHYRVLFVAACALFVMTFALNTVAETIRQHFRKKAKQL